MAASGNKAQNGNPLEFPAAALGGTAAARDRPLGRRHAADGAWAAFSTTTTYVSLAAPGAGRAAARSASLHPARQTARDWDDRLLPAPFSRRRRRAYAYGEGTSFAAPIASGIAALVWQVSARLASEQVRDVLIRSARQTVGRGWNQFTGAGIDGRRRGDCAGAQLRPDPPPARGSAGRRDGTARVAVRWRPRPRPHRARAASSPSRVTYGLLVSRDGGRHVAVGQRGARIAAGCSCAGAGRTSGRGLRLPTATAP